MSIRASLPPPPFFLFFFLLPLSNILYLSSHAKYTRTLGITSLLLIYFEYIPQRPARPGGGRARGRGQRGGGGHGHGAAVLVRARGHRVAAARLLARAARVAGLRVPAGADHAQHALPDTHRAAGTLGRRPLIVRSLTTRSLTCFSVQLKTILIFFRAGCNPRRSELAERVRRGHVVVPRAGAAGRRRQPRPARAALPAHLREETLRRQLRLQVSHTLNIIVDFTIFQFD